MGLRGQWQEEMDMGRKVGRLCGQLAGTGICRPFFRGSARRAGYVCQPLCDNGATLRSSTTLHRSLNCRRYSA
jgi:hypothetical protein